MVQRATLRLHVPAGAGTGTVDGPAVYRASNAWAEGGVTWANRPARGPVARDDTGVLPAGARAEFDVTPLVAGNGTFSFALAGTSADAASFDARESGADALRLVVTTGPPS